MHLIPNQNNNNTLLTPRTKQRSSIRRPRSSIKRLSLASSIHSKALSQSLSPTNSQKSLSQTSQISLQPNNLQTRLRTPQRSLLKNARTSLAD